MKKLIAIFFIGAAFLLASCSASQPGLSSYQSKNLKKFSGKRYTAGESGKKRRVSVRRYGAYNHPAVTKETRKWKRREARWNRMQVATD